MRRRNVLPALGLVLMLAGCGSATKAAAPSTASPTTAPGPASRQAYTSCVEGHGIPAAAATARPRGSTSPTSLPAGVTQSQLRAARQACRSLLPRSGFGGGLANSPQAAAYRNCLGLHGVTLPARGTSSTTTPGATPSPSFDPNTPTVKAAMQACAALRPQAGPSTTTSTT